MKRGAAIVLAVLVVIGVSSKVFMHGSPSGVEAQASDAYMAFRRQADCERYADTAFTGEDSVAVKALWDHGEARFMTKAATNKVLSRYPGKKCEKIVNLDVSPDDTVLWIKQP